MQSRHGLVLLLLLLAASCLSQPSAESSERCKKPADVVVLVDGSESISETHFEEMKSTLIKLLNGLEISQNETRIGIVLYSDTVRDRQTLSGNSTILESWITNLKRPGTMTGKALQTMLEEFGDEGRPDVPQIGMVITDGSSDDSELTKSETAKVKATGVTMFSVGTDSTTSQDQLQLIATSPDRVIMMENFDSLLTQVHGQVKEVCDAVKPHCTGRLDVVAVVDGSDSIYPGHFRRVQQALLKFVDKLDLKPDGVRLAIVLFGWRVSYATNLNGDAAAVRAQINALKQPGGGTNTHLALERMAAIFRNQGRTGVTRTGIVLTDGNSNNRAKTVRVAKTVKAQGISMFAVGVGTYIKDLELRTIASSPAQALRVTNFDQLLKVVESLVDQVCSASP